MVDQHVTQGQRAGRSAGREHLCDGGMVLQATHQGRLEIRGGVTQVQISAGRHDAFDRKTVRT